jgi:TonB family protein
MNPLWLLGNLAAYSVQVALLVGAAQLAAAVLRLKQPRVRLAYWQALLAACLLLPLVETWHPMDLGPGGGAATIIGTGAVTVASHLNLFPLPVCGLLVFVAGVGAGLLRLALGVWRLGRYRQAALHIDPLPGALREAQALVKVAPAFYFSDHIPSPVTFGWRHPAIIFPRRFEHLNESEQRAIACHELLHVVRRDWLMNLLEELILTFFWFHPAIWWAMRNIRLAREQVVDSLAVALTGARKPYLRALLEMAGAPRATVLPAPWFLVESQLARRVAVLVKEVHMSKPRLIVSLGIALTVLVAAGWWAVSNFWLIAPAGPPTQQTSIEYWSGGAPGSGEPSTFMMFFLVNGDDRNTDWQMMRTDRGAHIKWPVPISTPAPPYTPQAKKDKVKGAIVAAVGVDDGGNVAGVKLTVVSLTRNLRDGLDQSVIDTVRTWKFKPATNQGKPVPVTVRLQVNFNLG